jgi:acyl carrier protein
MTRQDVRATIVKIIDDLDDQDPSERQGPDDIAFAQRGLDSFTTIRLVLTLMVEFDVQLNPTEICGAAGLGQLVDLLKGKLSAHGSLRNTPREVTTATGGSAFA